MYLNLSNTDNCSCFFQLLKFFQLFNFICKKERNIQESEFAIKTNYTKNQKMKDKKR